MNPQESQIVGREGWRGHPPTATLLGILAGLGMAAMVLFYAYYFQSRIGPAQPLPFSHRLHAGDKQIGCVVCHSGVANSPSAGIPPLQTCMLCHEHIIREYPYIRELRRHYEQNIPVIWTQVDTLHEYAFFNHQMHVQRGIDCGHCHGDVKAMDRIYQFNPFHMGFCIQCHRDYGASHDCLTCHR
jgi:hypothetical protein